MKSGPILDSWGLLMPNYLKKAFFSYRITHDHFSLSCGYRHSDRLNQFLKISKIGFR